MTDVVNGKTVFGAPDEILEVKNAYRAYEQLLEYDPCDVNDFLRAHGVMANDLVHSAGMFRSKSVGVYAGDVLIHAGAKAEFVPRLMRDLFDWADNSDIHPLIKSSIMHFEIEFIHPFADGNGRLGRLWQTLVLAQWN